MSHEFSPSQIQATNQQLAQMQKVLFGPLYLAPIPNTLRTHIPEGVKRITKGFFTHTFFDGGKIIGRKIANITGLKGHEAEAIAESFQLALSLIDSQPLLQQVQDPTLVTEEEETVTLIRQAEAYPQLYQTATDAYQTGLLKNLMYQQDFYAWEDALSLAGTQLAMYMTLSPKIPPRIERVREILHQVEEFRPVEGTDFDVLNQTILVPRALRREQRLQKYPSPAE